MRGCLMPKDEDYTPQKYLLITPLDVKNERTARLKHQGHIDPVVNDVIPFGKGALDHDHKTDSVRAVLHSQNNAALGKVENAFQRYVKPFFDISISDWLANMSEFLSEDYSQNPLHPMWIKRSCISFNYLPEKQKDAVLKEFNKYEPKSNGKKRNLAFKALLTGRCITRGEAQEVIEAIKGDI